LYAVKFADGAEAEYSANVIYENMWTQCNINCIDTNYLMPLSTTSWTGIQSSVQMAEFESTVNSTVRRSQRDGNYVSNGKMAQGVGKGLLT
jgi:hypothetical protein